MKLMTILDAARAMGGAINQPHLCEQLIAGVSFDTREDVSGKLFFAITDKRDGHDFIHDAIAKGAACVVSRIPTDAPAIIVPDTIRAMGDLAQYYRSLLGVKVIGITGSNGKTTTKDLMASVLSQKYKVLKTSGNLNNHLGMPATIFKMDESTEIAVLEMGMNHRWEIHRLSDIARPDYAVITNIGLAHLENLGSQEEIFRAKSEIFEFLKHGGKVFLNGEDNFLLRYRERANFEFFGFGAHNNVRASDVQDMGINGSRFTLNDKQRIFLPAPGRHMISNALAACALGLELGLEPAEIAVGIESFDSSGRRMSIIRAGEIKIIDDCYNASPDSMKAALDVLASEEGRKIAILGDMFELGEDAPDFHYEVGRYAAAQNLDLIVCIGEMASNFMYNGAYDGIDVNGLRAKTAAIPFASAADFLSNWEGPRPGDIVLVKASRGMKFEEIVMALTQSVGRRGGY